MRNRFPDLCVAVGAKRRKWKASLPARIRPTIEKALAEDPPPSLMQIAKRVGIGTLKALKKYYPNLQQKVASRQAAFRRARDRQRLRISKATLRSGFYNLCEAIGERYRMGFTTARVRD